MKKINFILMLIVIFMFVAVTDVSAITAQNLIDNIDNFSEVVDVVNNNGIYEVTLKSDVELDLEIYSGDTVVLDLNGYTLKNYTIYCEAIKVYSGGTLTIKDSGTTGKVTTKDDSTYSVITNQGTLIIGDGNYETTLDYYVIRNEGDLTVKGGTFTSTSTRTSLIGNIVGDDATVTPTITIEDGTFSALMNVIMNNEDCEVTIDGGSLTSEYFYALDNFAIATVNGGTLTSNQNTAIRTSINNPEEYTASSLVVSNSVTLNSATEYDYTIYDYTLNEDVTSSVNVSRDENGNITVTAQNDSDEEVTNPDEIENPSTNDNILKYVVLGIVSLIAIASITIFLKKKEL